MGELVEDEDGEFWMEAGFGDGWDSVVIEYDDDFEGHVVPVGDTGSHVAAEDCPCCPQMNYDGVWIHRAYDDRDAYEEKRRRPS